MWGDTDMRKHAERSLPRRERRAGFTLIEIVIVIAVLGILAAVAMGRFYNFTDDAKAAATRRQLGNIRVAIRNFGMEKVANGEAHAVPTALELRGYANSDTPASSQALAGYLPGNPYFVAPTGQRWRENLIRATTDAKGAVSESNLYAWAYNESNGQFWANTNVVGENSW